MSHAAKKLKTKSASTPQLASLSLIDIERRMEELHDELSKLLDQKEKILYHDRKTNRPSYLC
jgi:hypothetical protein